MSIKEKKNSKIKSKIYSGLLYIIVHMESTIHNEITLEYAIVRLNTLYTNAHTLV